MDEIRELAADVLERVGHLLPREQREDFCWTVASCCLWAEEQPQRSREILQGLAQPPYSAKLLHAMHETAILAARMFTDDCQQSLHEVLQEMQLREEG